jgi:hypothetical protein
MYKNYFCANEYDDVNELWNLSVASQINFNLKFSTSLFHFRQGNFLLLSYRHLTYVKKNWC